MRVEALAEERLPRARAHVVGADEALAGHAALEEGRHRAAEEDVAVGVQDGVVDLERQERTRPHLQRGTPAQLFGKEPQPRAAGQRKLHVAEDDDVAREPPEAPQRQDRELDPDAVVVVPGGDEVGEVAHLKHMPNAAPTQTKGLYRFGLISTCCV
ncbi:MAG: hypothetical protein JST92_08555 [Deltaproteobacteria bacterium]|nr:hypothetical protein [Deltaproteobacteria bacterium]